MKKLIFLAFWMVAILSAQAQTYEVKHTLSADSTTTGVEILGEYTFGARGDFGGGSLEFQISNDQADGYATYATFSSDSTQNVQCNCWFRWKLIDTTDPNLETSLKKFK